LDVCGNELEAQMTSLKMHQLQTVAANSLIDCQQKCQQFEYRLHPLIHTFLLQFQSNAQFMVNNLIPYPISNPFFSKIAKLF
jgi:hypothetical protein